MQPFARTDEPVLVQWLVDTRPLWPEASETRQLQDVAHRALAVLLSDDERRAVLRYVHVRDAKMALVSQLLKHFAVARCGCIPWSQTHIARIPAPHGKPGFRDADTGRAPVAFNVSHQAGVVVLAAVYGGGAGGKENADENEQDDPGRLFDLGVDVVAPAERRARDHQMLAEAPDGWARFVDMHAEVLAAEEVAALKAAAAAAPSPSRSSHPDVCLRRFYALWCLREAYVKMTGDALLAPWLKALAFRAYTVPENDDDDDDAADDGDMVIAFHGQRVTDVHLRLAALGGTDDADDYMVCTAVRSPRKPAAARALAIGDYEAVDVDAVVDFAERYWGDSSNGRGDRIERFD